MKAIERLKALEEAGIALSRNRHFAFFEAPENQRALTLSRYLDHLCALITEGFKRNAITLSLQPDEHGRLGLRMQRADLSVDHTAHLSPEEFDALTERDGIADILKSLGISWS